MACVLCGGSRREVFRAQVLGDEARFVYCDSCGLLQADEPTWLDKAYLSPLTAADTGAVQRNLQLRDAACTVWSWLFKASGRFVDVAGGSGLFARLMRDVGYDYWWSDKYAENVFARGYEAAPGEGFDGATAIEVFEHLPDPAGFVHETLAEFRPSALLFTTQLFEGEPPGPEWWYYSLATGQHVSFYQRRTLVRLADAGGMQLTSAGGLHLFSRQGFPEHVLRLAGSRLSPVAARLARRGRRSLIEPDHQRALRAHDARG